MSSGRLRADSCRHLGSSQVFPFGLAGVFKLLPPAGNSSDVGVDSELMAALTVTAQLDGRLSVEDQAAWDVLASAFVDEVPHQETG